MARLLFEKLGNAAWISHLDLMRLFQRAFKRAGLPLTHTQGYNPRPSVSIALPLSVGIQSQCELLDFDLEGDPIANAIIKDKLNAVLADGIRVLDVYNDGRKLRDLSLLRSVITLEYDAGIPQNAESIINELFLRESLVVMKRSKNGIQEQNIITMIRNFAINRIGECELQIHVLACCQNPTLNPAQIVAAIHAYASEAAPSFAWIRRDEIYDAQETVFR